MLGAQAEKLLKTLEGLTRKERHADILRHVKHQMLRGDLRLERLVWAYGRHVNRTIANLGSVFEDHGYALERFSMVVPRWRKLPAMMMSARWQDGRLRGYSSIHPWTYRHLRVPKTLAEIPVLVFGDMILSDAPHFFYQDLNFQTIIDHRVGGIRTFMYDQVPLSILHTQARVQAERYARAKTVFVMSHWIKEAIVATGSIPAQRVQVVGAGSNLGVQFTSNPYTEANLDAKRLVFVGRDFERKGGPLLLEAWDQVHRWIPDAQLVLVGPDPAFSNPAQHITSLGDLPAASVVALFLHSTGFVLPTLWEPYGIAFLEAFSCGVPGIGPNRMAIGEFLVDRHNGYLYERDDPSQIAEAMARLLKDREHTWAMSHGAFEESREYTWDRVYQKMSETLTALRDPLPSRP